MRSLRAVSPADLPPVARYQDGVFTVAQALEAGWTRSGIRSRRAAGQWIVVAGRGLALPADGTFTPRMLARAALLTWPHGVVGHRIAAALHGLPVAVTDTDPVDVLTVAGQRPLVRMRPRTPFCEPDDVALTDGLRITTLTRTSIDCLAFLPIGEALDLYAWLSAHELLTRHAVLEAVEARRGRPGVTQLARLTEVVSSGAVSAAEHRLHGLLRSAFVEGWSANTKVLVDGVVIAVADVLFDEQQVVIEVDGFRAHSGRDQFVDDRRRQNALVNAGYTVLRFTWWDLTQRPDAVLAEIRRALRRGR
jgi:very-short-patch-repair endonuclease